MKNSKKVCKRILFSVIAVLLAVSIVFIVMNFGLINILPFDDTYVWDAPSYAVRYGESTYVVDSSKTSVSVLNDDMSIKTILRGNSDEKSFTGTDYISVNDDGLYIADVEYAQSGTRVSAEYIKHFDSDGNYIETVFSAEYEEGKETMPAQNGYVCWMGEHSGKIYFIYYNKEFLSIYSILGNGYALVRSVPADVIPEIWNVAYSAEENKLWIVGKDSRIHCENADKNGFELFDNGALYAEGVIYSDIDVYDSNVYATDLGLRRVVCVNDGAVLIGGENVEENPIIYRLSAYSQGVITTDNDSIILASADDGAFYWERSVKLSSDYYRAIVITWICVCYVVLLVLTLLMIILIHTIKNNPSKYVKTALLIAGTIVASTAIISTTIINDTFVRITDGTLASLVRTADVISSSSRTNGIGDAVEKVESIGDYGNDEHQFIQNYLDAFCDAAYNSGSNMYYVLYRFDDSLVYGVADYEKTAGAIYPYCPYDESVYKDVVETGEIISVAESSDAYGSWSFANAPIFNSDGEIVAVIEMGINMKTEQNENAELIMSIIIKIAVIILIIILFIIEGTILMDGVSKFRTERNHDIPYFLRPMVFLTFFASNLSAAFIPQMSLKLFGESSLNFSDSLASALPMSLQLFAIAVAAFACGKLLEKYRMKSLMILSCVIQVCGYIVIAVGAMMSNYLMFAFGHVLSGFGIGFSVVSLNALPDQVDDENLRNSYYSHLNAGIISGVVVGCAVGSYIADFFGYAVTFFVSAAVVLLIFMFIMISVGKGKHAAVSEIEEETRMSSFKFLTNRNVLSFVICVMVPFLVMLYFKDYLFPMFGYENGMDDVTIGNILLFAGATSIVFGTTVSEWLFKHFGNMGIITISSVVTSACLIMFGLYPTQEIAIATVFILSFVAGFGLAGQEVFYSSLPEFKRYGAKRSMSVYSICDNISQTAGPLLMGGLLFLGYGGECFAIGIVCIALFVIFRVITLFSRKSDKKSDRK